MVACRIVASWLSAFAVFGSVPSRAVAGYIVTDLGTLGGTTSYATAINNAGQVVGYSPTSVYLYPDGTPYYHAFRYSSGAMQDLGPGYWRFGIGTSINDSGQVAGYSFGPGTRAFFPGDWLLDEPPYQGANTLASRINNSGQVLGLLNGQPFLYSKGVIQPLSGLFFAEGLNNLGQVAGTMNIGNLTLHAVVLRNGTIRDLGTLGGSGSRAVDISDSGQVVGSAQVPGDKVSHAFLYSGGRMQDLGAPGVFSSFASHINSSEQVLGATFGGSQTLLYDKGQWTDLNTLIPADSHWQLEVATDINDRGQIVGWGINPDGQEHAFLLTPQAAPEPGAFTLLAIGTIGICGAGWWRRGRAA